MIKRTFFFGLLATVVLLQACYYDNETILYRVGSSGATCDTTNVTYSATIVPILAANCNSCHTNSSGNGVVTTDYTNLKKIVTNGQLVNSVNGTGGIVPMPLGGQKMIACNLLKISKWVSNGALNN